jgi:hypothetical protein
MTFATLFRCRQEAKRGMGRTGRAGGRCRIGASGATGRDAVAGRSRYATQQRRHGRRHAGKGHPMTQYDINLSIAANTRTALALARGCWQRNVIHGCETLGGSTLRGRAKSYAGRYQCSGCSLLARLRGARIPHHVEYGPRGGYHSARLVIDAVRL